MAGVGLKYLERRRILFVGTVCASAFLEYLSRHERRQRRPCHEYDEEINSNGGTVKTVMWLIAGLLLLVASSRMLVWGAVEVAFFGVSDTIIGLTVIAIGTSLPELASSLMAVKKGEHDLAIGNVIGSNMFNTLAVVGIAGTIQPMTMGSGFCTGTLW